MDLKLISFKICPFVQRAVITLLHKNIPFAIEHIDLADPPDWFVKLSPFGKTPVLQVDGRHTIFESAVIDEFLDEITPGRLLPEDPLLRALDRSWIEFGSAMIMSLSGIINAASQEKYEKNFSALCNQFAWLENILGDGPWFNGEQLSLVDFTYAPLFMRMDLLKFDQVLYSTKALAKSQAWGERLNDLQVVQDSVVEEFAQLLLNLVRNKGAYTAHLLGL